MDCRKLEAEPRGGISAAPEESNLSCSEDEGCAQAAPTVGREGGPGAPLQSQQGWLCRAGQQPATHKTAAGVASASHLASGQQPPAQGDSTLFLHPQPEPQASTASALNLPHAG